jgi:predicted secreted hydrolase
MGSLQARFTPEGPVLNYSGIGLAKLLSDVDREYAFPAMRTAGTLAAEGKTREVSGVSWLDRQWGPVPVTDPSMRWTWMNIALSNGDQLALWDIVDNQAQHSWVTVLHPDGSYQLAAVRPLAEGASRFWTSPVTRKTYPTRWRIDIPAARSRLTVLTTGPRGQEFPDGHIEGAAAVTGSSQGTTVTGTTFVEMTGDWSRRRSERVAPEGGSLGRCSGERRVLGDQVLPDRGRELGAVVGAGRGLGTQGGRDGDRHPV